MSSLQSQDGIPHSNGHIKESLVLDVNTLSKTENNGNPDFLTKGDNSHDNLTFDHNISCVEDPSSLPIDGPTLRNDKNDDNENDYPSNSSFFSNIFSWRYGIIFLLHASFMVGVFARNSMAIGLVCMTSSSSNFGENDTHFSRMGNASNQKSKEFEFSWDSETQGLILSSVSFLSFISPLISSVISQKIGHRTTLSIVTLTMAGMLFAIPAVARTGSFYLILLRFFLGASFGANVPAAGDLVSKWAPAQEKQTMITIVYTGLQTGGILCNIISGYLCTIPVDNGWPFIFYFVGAACIVWVVLWQCFSAGRPENHKYLSQKELSFILKHRGYTPSNQNDKKKAEKPPYRAIITSVPVITLVICGSAMFWSYSVFFAYQPIYLSSVLRFEVTEVGVIMTCLSSCRLIGMGITTVIINRLIGCNRWSVNRVKKSIVFVGMSATIGFQVMVIVTPSEYRYVIVVALLGLLFSQAAPACILPSVAIDIAPRYAGFLSAIFFSSGSLVGLTAPLIVAAMTPNGTEAEWRNVWIILGCAFVLLLVVFTAFGDCSVQKWAIDNPKNPSPVTTDFSSLPRRLSTALATPPILSTNPDKKYAFNFNREANISTLPTPDKNHQPASNPYTTDSINCSDGVILSSTDERNNNDYHELNKGTSTINSNGVENTGLVNDTLSSNQVSDSSSEERKTKTVPNENVLIHRF